MKVWLVDPDSGVVREFNDGDRLDGEKFLFGAPTAHDAMLAGHRRRLAKKALRWACRFCHDVRRGDYVLVADAITPQAGGQAAVERLAHLADALRRGGWDAWTAGLTLLVFAIPDNYEDV